MKVIASSCESLLKPLKHVEGIVERRQTLPIISNVLVEVADGRTTLTTTDLDIQIRTHAPVGIEGVREVFTVSASKLSSVLNALAPQANVEISTTEKKVEISSGRSFYSMPNLPAKDFPVILPGEWKVAFTIEASMLRHLFNLTSFAMPAKPLRYFLNGVLLEIEGKTIRAVATDTHRLACCESELEHALLDEPLSCIIPKKTVRELNRILPEDDTPVHCQFTETQFCLRFGDIEFMSKLVEGKFPNYRSVMNAASAHPHILELNREQLIDILRRVAIMTSDKFRGIRWKVRKNLLTIQSSSQEQEEAMETIEIDWDKDEAEMGFNVTYLIEVLSLLKNNTILLQFGNTSGAVLLSMPDSNSFKYVVMPMRI